MRPIITHLAGLLMALALALSGQGVAMASMGNPAVMQMVICGADGPTTVWLDEQGNPGNPVQDCLKCPKCLASDIPGAMPDRAQLLPFAHLVPASLCVGPGVRVLARAHVFANPRAPPAAKACSSLGTRRASDRFDAVATLINVDIYQPNISLAHQAAGQPIKDAL